MQPVDVTLLTDSAFIIGAALGAFLKRPIIQASVPDKWLKETRDLIEALPVHFRKEALLLLPQPKDDGSVSKLQRPDRPQTFLKELGRE